MLYPILTPSRLLIDLGGTWDFKPDDGRGFSERWYASPLTEPLHMPVPASYNDLTESEELREHCGWVFYQRRIAVPALAPGQRVVLRCEAVTHHARVYLNGELLCEHRGGFLPFETELTGRLSGGEDLLTIAVDNTIDYTTLPVGGKSDMMSGMLGLAGADSGKRRNNPNFDFFNYAGITRPVRLYTTPEAHIEDITVVPELEGADARLSYTVDTVGEGECVVEVRERGGRLVARAEGASGVLEIPDVHLWRPRNAYLYDIRVRFGSDEYTLPYGVRTVRVEGERFLINGEPFYFKGYGRHEDSFSAGPTSAARAAGPSTRKRACRPASTTARSSATSSRATRTMPVWSCGASQTSRIPRRRARMSTSPRSMSSRAASMRRSGPAPW